MHASPLARHVCDCSAVSARSRAAPQEPGKQVKLFDASILRRSNLNKGRNLLFRLSYKRNRRNLPRGTWHEPAQPGDAAADNDKMDQNVENNPDVSSAQVRCFMHLTVSNLQYWCSGHMATSSPHSCSLLMALEMQMMLSLRD